VKNSSSTQRINGFAVSGFISRLFVSLFPKYLSEGFLYWRLAS
jgi:hypothetical protein